LDPKSPLHACVWQEIARNAAWFALLEELGYWRSWLTSGDDKIVDRTLLALTRMTARHGEAIADLVRPLVVGGWRPDLVRGFLLRSAAIGQAHVGLFVDATKAGTFDNGPARDFWRMLREISGRDPAGAVDALAVMLERARTLASAMDSTDPFMCVDVLRAGSGTHAEQAIACCAEADPQAFVDRVLPWVLDLIQANERPEWECQGGIYDQVWYPRRIGFHARVADHLYGGLAVAFARVDHRSPEQARVHEVRLRDSPHAAARRLLALAYTRNPAVTWERAVQWLLDVPEAQKLGYLDSAGQVTRDLVRAVTPFCRDQRIDKLTRALLPVMPPDEGHGDWSDAPLSISPELAAKMSDEEWLEAIATEC
jgi:hypothetical protein